MQQFRVARLVGSEARLAYPLVREAEPSVGLQGWLGFARRAGSPHARRTGIMVATRVGQRFPSGLLCFRCHNDLVLGLVMTAEYFIAVDMLDPLPVVDAMLAALETVGARLGCKAVRSVLRPHSARVVDCLRRGGHRPETTVFIKRLHTATVTNIRDGAATAPGANEKR